MNLSFNLKPILEIVAIHTELNRCAAKKHLNEPKGQEMSAIREDIKKQSDYIVKTFDTEGLKLDYTVKSFAQIDTFFELNSKNGKPVPGSKLSQNLEATIFSIGSYIGETVLKSVQRAAGKLMRMTHRAKMRSRS